MPKKQIITTEEIKKDLANAIKYPPALSKKDHRKAIIPSTIVGPILIILAILFHKFILWFFIAILIFLILAIIFEPLRRAVKAKKVKLEDYCISEEIVSHVEKEEYKVSRSTNSKNLMGSKFELITNYIVHFENGKSWRIPPDNYVWSNENPMSDKTVFENIHRGDTVTVVTRKDTKEIVLAYDHDFFEYKNK